MPIQFRRRDSEHRMKTRLSCPEGCKDKKVTLQWNTLSALHLGWAFLWGQPLSNLTGTVLFTH
jgi:hypothetical protein